MSKHAPPALGKIATLQDVAERIASHPDLANTRKRDLRSAVVSYGKLLDKTAADIDLDLAEIRRTLDRMVPAQAKVSRKRWANLRSDLAAAIAASGLQPMLNTSAIRLDRDWVGLLNAARDKAISNGLSRLARWASYRQLPPTAIDSRTLDRFFQELEAGTLARNLGLLRRSVAKTWNKLARLLSNRGLQMVEVGSRTVSKRLPWSDLPVSLRREADDYLRWCSVPDPLADNARSRRLAKTTLRLRRDYIHLAACAACMSGISVSQLTSLACLVEPETLRTILRTEWERQGRTITPYLRDLASGLILMAAEWVKVSAEQLDALKKVRAKLGTSPSGLTKKNRALLRLFEDERLKTDLIQMPDKLWRTARRNVKASRGWFIDMQNSLAIDVLLHVPMRIENLTGLKFDEQLQWPQGPKKPALVIVPADETKNQVLLEFELPTVLADRFYALRNETAPAVIGQRPNNVFVTMKGKPRTVATMRVAIQRTLRRHLGIHMTPHQFRHVAAKFQLDENPGNFELVRQLLGQKALRTTTRFYAGVDTRRAGRAHAELLNRLRNKKK